MWKHPCPDKWISCFDFQTVCFQCNFKRREVVVMMENNDDLQACSHALKARWPESAFPSFSVRQWYQGLLMCSPILHIFTKGSKYCFSGFGLDSGPNLLPWRTLSLTLTYFDICKWYVTTNLRLGPAKCIHCWIDTLPAKCFAAHGAMTCFTDVGALLGLSILLLGMEAGTAMSVRAAVHEAKGEHPCIGK